MRYPHQEKLLCWHTGLASIAVIAPRASENILTLCCLTDTSRLLMDFCVALVGAIFLDWLYEAMAGVHEIILVDLISAGNKHKIISPCQGRKWNITPILLHEIRQWIPIWVVLGFKFDFLQQIPLWVVLGWNDTQPSFSGWTFDDNFLLRVVLGWNNAGPSYAQKWTLMANPMSRAFLEFELRPSFAVDLKWFQNPSWEVSLIKPGQVRYGLLNNSLVGSSPWPFFYRMDLNSNKTLNGKSGIKPGQVCWGLLNNSCLVSCPWPFWYRIRIDLKPFVGSLWDQIRLHLLWTSWQ